MSEATVHWLLALIRSTVVLLIVLDPFGLLPLVVGVTAKMSGKQRRRMLTRAVLIGFALLLVFTFGGTAILSIFGITIDDLRVAGGILLLVIALSIVVSGHMSAEPTLDASAGVAPIASPLLVGPGSITTTVVLVRTQGPLITALAVTLAFFLTWLVLRATSLIYRVLGVSGSDVIARIMGVLLAAFAIAYIREGVVNIIKTAGKAMGH